MFQLIVNYFKASGDCNLNTFDISSSVLSSPQPFTHLSVSYFCLLRAIQSDLTLVNHFS